MEIEKWRMIDDFEGYYEVSNIGRVRSLSRRDSIGRRRTGLVLRQTITPNGYLQVSLSKGGKNQQYSVHRLVALAFIGAIPLSKQVDHIDGNKLNNASSNLRYVSALENIRSGIAIGLHAPRKLKQSDLPEIRRLALEGMSQTAIGKHFNVSGAHIGRILHGKHYKLV
jgi:hypothetical protein